MTRRIWADWCAAGVMRTLAWLMVALALAIAGGLYLKARPVLAAQSLAQLLLTGDWRPLQGQFGFLPFIAGTVAVTGLALLIAVPLSLLSAIYLSEYASRRMRACVTPAIDLLAAIPSVIFGIWGVVAVVPFVKVLAGWCGHPSSGYSLLAGALVLAVMVFPIIISVASGVLTSVPVEAREAALALGATRWETTWHVVLKRAAPGIIAAVVLGFSRACGETMAVLMVAGNVARVPHSLFDPVHPLPALIANNYGEMMSIPRYDAALMLAALLLLVVVAGFNVGAQWVLQRAARRWQ